VAPPGNQAENREYKVQPEAPGCRQADKQLSVVIMEESAEGIVGVEYTEGPNNRI